MQGDQSKKIRWVNISVDYIIQGFSEFGVWTLNEKKVAIVTGGTRGIGFGIVQCFLEKGYRVVMNYRQDDKQAELASKKLNSDEVFLIKADVTKSTDRNILLSKAVEKFGRVDVLVNNAAIIRLGRFLEITPAVFSEVMECNFYAPLYLTQEFANILIDKKQTGSIINILSVGAYGAGNISYCTSKAALLFATKCMAKELAKFNIRVNSVSPNAVPTNLNQSARDESPDRWNKFINKTPMKREASAQEVASAVIYLASDEASYTTGVDIPVDGGLLC